MAESITLQTSDSNVQQSDVLGRLSFAASNESNTSDARLIGGSIYAMAEGDFTEIANPTSLVFATASSESATSKLKITSEGHFLPLSSGQYDLGSTLYPFRNVNTNILSFNIDDESALTKGQISWDDTEGTMDVGLTDNTTIHVGSHRYFRVRNETGGTLYKGQVVYATGVHSNGIITPNLYIANDSIDEVRFMGVMLEDLNSNNNGYVIDFGHLENLDLDGSATNFAVGDETWSAGDILYAHPSSSGKLTNVKPKHAITVAIILDVGNGNGNGRMFVRTTMESDLGELHDVNVDSVTNGQFLQYNSATDYWVPSSSGNFTYLTRNDAQVIISDNTGVTGADIVDNLISLTQSEYDAITPDVDTVYVITDASAIACCIDGSGIANYSAKWSDSDTLTSGIIYDNGTNVGIGTTNPGSFNTAFNKLVIGNGGTYQGATIYSSVQGTLAFGDTATTTVDGYRGYVAYIHNTDYMVLGTAGAERVRINSAGDVGIGTSAPSAKLNVEGGNVIFNDLGGNYDFRVEGDTDANLLFTDASSDRVGIGISSPQAKLDINGTVRFNDLVRWEYPDKALDTSVATLGYMRLYDETGAYAGLGVSTSSFNIGTSGAINFRTITNGVERSVIDSNGNFIFNEAGNNCDFRIEGDTDANLLFTDASTDRVGIGTSSPTNKLTVIGAASFGTLERTPNNADAAGFYNRIEAGGGTQATKSYGSIWLYNASNTQTHSFHSYPGTDNYINNGGNFGVGTSSPSYKLDVVGTGNFSHVISSGCPAVISNTGIASGSDQILNIVSLTQAEYDAATKNSQTLYIIT